MAHFLQQLNDHTLCVTFSGLLGQEDLQAVQGAARALIAKGGPIRAMFILQNFQGFARGVDWGNLDFYAEHGDDIQRMAIVGDEQWKASALVFTGKGARKTQIEFFAPAAILQAQTWLAQS